MGVIHLGLLLNSSYPTQPHSLIANYSPPPPPTNLDQEKLEFHVLFVESTDVFSWVSQFSFIIGWQVCFRSVNPPFCYLLNINEPVSGEQGWHSGESTRLPPIWPRLKSRRRRHMWVEFVVGSLPCSERYFSGYSSFPLSPKTNISKFQFDQESGRQRTTMWMWYLQIVIYICIYFIHFICLVVHTKIFGECQDWQTLHSMYFGGLSFEEMGRENGECSC